MTDLTTITFTLSTTTARALTQEQIDEAGERMTEIVDALVGPDDDGGQVDLTVTTSYDPNPVYDNTVQTEQTEFSSDLEALAAQVYNTRAQSPQEMTPERWDRICKLFPSSARGCRAEAQRIMDEED